MRRIKEKPLLHKNKKEGTENECVFRDITTEYEELAVKSSDRRVLPVWYMSMAAWKEMKALIERITIWQRYSSFKKLFRKEDS